MKINTFNNLNIDSLLHIFALWTVQKQGDLYASYLTHDTAVMLNTSLEQWVLRNEKYHNINLKSLLLK